MHIPIVFHERRNFGERRPGWSKWDLPGTQLPSLRSQNSVNGRFFSRGLMCLPPDSEGGFSSACRFARSRFGRRHPNCTKFELHIPVCERKVHAQNARLNYRSIGRKNCYRDSHVNAAIQDGTYRCTNKTIRWDTVCALDIIDRQ